MSNIRTRIASGLSSLRSTMAACLTLTIASIFKHLNAIIFESPLPVALRNSRKSQKCLFSSPLILVNIEQAADNLPIGAHLISPRKFYMHHGIHVGGGDVVHYSGFSSALKSGPIEVIDLEIFADGKTVWMLQEKCEYSNDEIANRARSRVGESQYKILSNNCEHFCSWCTSGKSYSAQVKAYLHCPLFLLSFISTLEPFLTA
ncbi:lecithin retinol acyltransferase family protein [Pseudomonas fluorescens]|uniref:lecithin retinol acyltransferase family protein n=1 Tax=Pseudomonas fluorescens TaxID=294 RepID=UPI0009B8A826|nr:lecithin retinol acyltransferase family protein [Pseudomonas fluorescens]